MSNNAQKTPFARALSKFVQRSFKSETAALGQELPGNIVAVNANATAVTVNLEVPGLNIVQVTMPVAMSKYARFPLKAGDPGVAVSSSAYLGTVSGLGTGSPAAAALQPNLSALVWIPISNAKWASVSAQDCVLTDATGASVLTLSPTGIMLAFGGKSVVINSSGVTMDGILFDTHTHSGVTTGSGDSGPPVP